MFSVVIPLYNKELSIINTINSVLNQKFQKFEIIVVNDGSTDKSIEKVLTFNDTRIKILNKENGGVSSARNMGIAHASHEWIAFLDGDDLWEVSHLELIVEMIKKFPNEKVFATSFKYSDNRKFPRKSFDSNINIIENYFKSAMEEVLAWTSVMVLNRKCFETVAPFNEKLSLGEDMELWNRLMKVFKLVKCTSITAVYRVEAENRSVSKKENLKKSILSTMTFDSEDKYENEWNRNFIKLKIKQFIVNKKFDNALYLVLKYNFNLL